MDQTTENPLFAVDLQLLGDDDSAFRYRNAPGEIQRGTIIDRRTSLRSDLAIHGKLVTVIHGKFANNSSAFATLIVAHFEFMGSDSGRTFSNARITLAFRGKERKSEDCDFEVFKIEPYGQHLLNPSEADHELQWVVGLNAGVNATATAGAQRTHQATKKFKRQDCGSFSGSMSTVGRGYGPKNAAIWSMRQNKIQKNGIPTALDVAILLKREHNKPFLADVEVTAGVDIIYGLERSFGKLSSRNRIDPITFDPSHQTGNLPDGIDINCLSQYAIVDLTGIEKTPQLRTV